MKKTLTIFLIGIVLLLGSNSCNDYLDQVPNDLLTLDKVFETRETTLRYLNTAYTFMPDEFQQRDVARGNGQGTSGAWTAGSDEAEYVWDGNGANTINNGSLTPSTGFVWDYWSRYYKGIRVATLFIENAHLCEVLSAGDLEQWTAEARAVRAIYYYYLFRLYGPVPIINTPLSEQASSADLQIPRNSVEEVANYILSELQTAMDNGLIDNIKTSSNVSVTEKGLGHIDQAIAKAFKIQTRMLAASHLFNGSNEYYSSMANPDGKKLFPNYSEGEKKQLWAAAAKEAEEFLTKYDGQNYGLTKVYTDGALDPYLSYREAVRGNKNDLTNFDSRSSSREMIFFRQECNASTMQYDRTPKHFGYPGNYTASGGCGAVQEIVDAYAMANGIKPITGYQSDYKTPIINPASGYVDNGFTTEDYLDPVTGRIFAPKGVLKAWANREPRFYADITFSGQKWLYDGEGDVYSYFNFTGNSGKGIGNSNDYSKTGYVVRKTAPLGPWGNGDRICILLRLAQIYLDYAEALNESEPSNPNILKYVNYIRERAGVPQYGTGSNALPIPSDMRQAIRDERRVELAFECARYFDVRRWGIAEETQNRPIHGMNIAKDGDEFYERTVVENRIFQKKHYFFPIPEKDININRALTQNMGW
ncbi:RagB/SusD family nutrient uptake outer membrane protein [Dysgonomonas sp. ZJ709]|uniref:RagB/SusD family nutrient uptake outer membrane protein n=1 Tax=Dysgonomonas sp. ZJ709 TaxID=2709797 RepID=UPI0013E99F03|nr:RagB/SusD family nutrient uptake outer membrane protein [Dysgonomonas sp. ZJ709]